MVDAAIDIATTAATPPYKPQDLRLELSSFRDGGAVSSTERQAWLKSFRVRVAASFEAWLGQRHQSVAGELEDAVNLLFELAEIGANDFPADEQPSIQGTFARRNATSRTLHSIALLPAWQSRTAMLSEVPAWMLPLAAAYHFSGPLLLTTAGQSEAFSQDYLRALKDLTRLVQANRGSATIRAALDCFWRTPSISPAWAGELWPEIAAARARLIGALSPRPKPIEPVLVPREGRRLRVGMVAESLVPQGAVASALTMVERLDSNRFELVLFSTELESPVAAQLKNRGADLVRIEPAAADALKCLQNALLDVLLFIADSSRPERLIHEIALNRVAPLQIWHDGLQETSGFPEIDLVIAGATNMLPRTVDLQPRFALLPGVGPCELNELRAEAQADVTRDEVGLSAEDFVLVSFAPLASIAPEMQVCWARILKRLPHARLLLCPGAGTPPESGWLSRFCQHFEEVLAAHGASSAQLLVFPATFAPIQARQCILALADVLLECGKHSDPESALVAADRGVPVVATNAASNRGHRTPALLALVGLEDLVSDHDGAYVPTVVRLATDAEWRQEIVQKWTSASTRLTAYHDSFAQSAAFGSAMERAFDGIALGREAFAATTEPLALPSAPDVELALQDSERLLEINIFNEASQRAHTALAGAPDLAKPRRLIAHCLKGLMNAGTAADWLLSQIALAPPSAAAWYEIAVASREAGRHGDSLTALQTALQIDPRHLDSWYYLGCCNDPVIREEVEKALRELAPHEPRTQKLFAEWRGISTHGN